MRVEHRRLLLGTEARPFPGPPTRDQVCRVKPVFAGVTVSTRQFGTLPWYDMALFALSSLSDRQAVYAAKRTAGATHCLMSFDTDEGSYVNKLGQYKDIKIPYSHMLHPEWMRADTREVIAEGFTPIVNLGGDGQGGIATALPGLHALVECLKADPVDLTRYVLVMPGWDGTFYGWSPDEIDHFGHEFRRLLPQGYLCLEHNPGHIPVGGGAKDWADGPMSNYDVLLSEFDYGDDVPPNDTIFQIVPRLLGPAWVRPPECEDYITTAYAIAHWYLASGTPRGRYYAIAFEWWATYDFVQWHTSIESIAKQRAYLSALGYGDCTG